MSTGSNLAFYRKYRPKTFEDIVGQEYIVQTLKNGVVVGTPAHAYLFTGSRGTGKTSAAKILAKALNCPNQTDGNPCLTCQICRGVDGGSVMDIMEIDAASNNGVDNIRDLREQAQFLPAVGRYRVYIIDEVHMLSIGAFNALLKIMEEPPEHVIFILATTEVHKIPATIISRCQRFDFKRIPADKIAAQLVNIAEKEGITLSEEAAMLIATLADGGLRDAVSILDKSASVSAQLDYETVAKIVGIAGVEHLFKISDYIKNSDTEQLLLIVDELSTNSLEPERLTEQLIEHFRSIMVTITVKNAAGILNVSPDNLEKLRVAAEKYTVSQIIYIQSCLQQSLNKMQKTVNKKAELELLLIKLCNPALETSVEALVLRIEKLEKMLENSAYAPAATVREVKVAPPAKAVEKPAPSAKTEDYKFEVPEFVKKENQGTAKIETEKLAQRGQSETKPEKDGKMPNPDLPPWEDAGEKQKNTYVPDDTDDTQKVEPTPNLPPWEDGTEHLPNTAQSDDMLNDDLQNADVESEEGKLPKAEDAQGTFESPPVPDDDLQDRPAKNPNTLPTELEHDTQNTDDTGEESEKQLFIAWDSALEKLKSSNGALYGALLGSKAYITKKHVLIDCKDTLFLVMMRENEYAKESLKKCIFEVTGQKYSIGPYKAQQKPEAAKTEDPLQKFVESLASLPDDIVEIK